MLRARQPIFLFVFCSLVISPKLSFSAEPGEESASPTTVQKDRNWTIAIPLWVPGYAGTFAIGDVEVEGESSGGSGLGRFLENEFKLRFAFMGAFSYEGDRWRIHGDIFGGKFTDDVIWKRKQTTLVSAELRTIIPRLHLAYRLFGHSWGNSGYQEVGLWAYAGVRIYEVKAEVELITDRMESAKASWADPVVGAWIPVDLSRRWWVEVSGDIGGFNVGSRLSWSLYLAGTYRASDLVSISLAYNFLDTDYHGTVMSKDFKWRARVAGPGMGIRFNF